MGSTGRGGRSAGGPNMCFGMERLSAFFALVLGSVDVHLVRITVAVRDINAQKTEKERKAYIRTLTPFGPFAGWSGEMLQIDLQHSKKLRLTNMAMIDGRLFHANGRAEPVRGQASRPAVNDVK